MATRLGYPTLTTSTLNLEASINEALFRFDVASCPQINSRTVLAPPPSSVDGDVYIVPVGASVAWAYPDNYVVYRFGGFWYGFLPNRRLYLNVLDEADQRIFWSGTAWVNTSSSGGGHVIVDEGVLVPAQPVLNFVGPGVVITDDTINSRTVVTITGGGGGGGAGITLTADRTYHLKTTGTRTALGAETDASTTADADAFGTLANVLAALSKLNANGFRVTLKVLAGTWGPLQAPNIPNCGTLVIEGVGDTTIIAGLFFNSYGLFEVDQLKLENPSGVCLAVDNGDVTVKTVNYGVSGNVHNQVTLNGILRPSQDYTISGGAAAHFAAYDLGKIAANPSAPRTITMPTSVSFGVAFAICERQGAILAVNQNYSGVATGPRYKVGLGGSVVVRGGAGDASPNYFPGNTPGFAEAATYGIYG